MLNKSLSELIETLGGMGYRFRSFTMTEEGEYSVDDASWNYKDIIHLKHVHHLVDAYPSHVSADVLATIYHQRVLGFKLPLTLVNYTSGDGRQTYHTSFLFFILIVETHFEELGPLRTRVVTEYAIGSKPLLVTLFFPIFKWAIKRNYDDLMTGDIAMRARRGQLRKWGYDFFKEGRERGFFESMRLDRQNVIPAPGRRPPSATRISLSRVPRPSLLKIGETDHYGLQITIEGSRLEIFPRICLHEGACLDVEQRPPSGSISCPWHGLKSPPIAVLPVDGHPRACDTKWHRFELTADELVIHYRETATLSPRPEPSRHRAGGAPTNR